MKTQVCIIGAGPAGLMLGRLLELAGIENVILEQKSKAYVLNRIRAGILEQTTVDLLKRAGASEHLEKEGIPHHGVNIAYRGNTHGIELAKYTDGKIVTAYGQTEVTKDLCDVREKSGASTYYESENVTIHDFDSAHPYVEFVHKGVHQKIACEIIAGCDGYHGVCRKSIPEKAITTYEKTYPFGWLGILSDTPPVAHEAIYVAGDRGFALCSMRSWTRSRYYIQCTLDDRVENWSDDAFWDEFRLRLPTKLADELVTGPSIEKSIAPLRSFVAEPLRFGRLVLAGDAAHIVPPTGAKGLNLAASDIHYLVEALTCYFANNDDAALDAYSKRALRRIWKAERFSWSLTNLLHKFDEAPFDRKMKEAEMSYLTETETGQRSVAENYVGLPL